MTHRYHIQVDGIRNAYGTLNERTSTTASDVDRQNDNLVPHTKKNSV